MLRYFPVAAPHTLPGMQPKLGHERAGTTCFERDDAAGEYLAEKQRLWSARHPPADGANRDLVLAWMRETIRAEHPGIADRVAAAATLHEAMLHVQEDVVVMRRTPDDEAAAATAAYLHVSFPTNWCPDCAHGRTFLELHEPVPALHAFAAANRPRLARSLFDQRRTSVRFVWTLTPDPRLDRPRCEAGLHQTLASSWEDASTAWFRVERQVIVPLTDAISLFLLRVYRADVRDLTRDQRELLRRSVAGMEPALAAYKGFVANADRILGLLNDGPAPVVIRG